ncbi:RNA-binding cell elongation regulator Jag/EloR [Anoxynatronum buryatiense]|uniref:RNA-binding protein KhpB n=1 Tax=Anoxynatronum buryatiense TaxID=489973 RepID=A0AA45WWF9_9CLOT|nr:RNA-binding cell elongation regulator Jag/EloR [Anoxynatronum buryatiense]SMP58396.1 spoIIIJ-associated protein [Anoxynatronum buryatiense]
MKTVEATGKTVEEAIANGLKELGCARENVEVKILEAPYRGLLGLIGSKDAKVQLAVMDQTEDETRLFLQDLFQAMELEVDIHIDYDDDQMRIDLSGPNMGMVIGKRGQTLDAVQYITSLVANKHRDKYVKVMLDTENYREKREQTLIRLANKMAKTVKMTRKTMVLEPMNPYERRIIHAALQSDPRVQTYSEGEEPYRKVAIALKK